jgi:hypothetical protein
MRSSFLTEPPCSAITTRAPQAARTERAHRTSNQSVDRTRTDRHFRVRGGDRNGQSVAVSAMHRAVAAPLRDVVTRRLSGRRLGFDDLNELATMFAHPEVWEFEYERGLTRSETEAFVDRQMKLWAECCIASNKAQSLVS